MPQRQRRVAFVFKGQPGFLYRPWYQRGSEDPVMAALTKHCSFVQVDGIGQLVRHKGADASAEEKQARLISDRGTVISITCGEHRIPVYER